MKRTYSNLWAVRLSPEQHKQTCGYWYTVTEGGAPHTAFATRQGLDRWMRERGLAIDGELPDAEWGCNRVVGTYRTESHYHDADAFPSLVGEKTREMSNGDYVEAVVTADADGVRTVHTLNPNVPRKVFDYRESDAMMK